MPTIKIRRFLFVITIFMLSLCSEAQQKRGVTVSDNASKSKTGNTYAVIVGINYTHRKNFSQLHYAVNDADLVKSFLQSGIFFDSIPDDNIKVILDKDATAIQLWYAFDWLTKKAKKGDRAIIYFAGHGIASGPALGFLIAYDAPDVSDPSQFGYQGGAIPIYQLKTTIEQLRNKGVTNYLITDACRNNEQKDSSQLNFPNILEVNDGEIQFSSCSRNQSSMEDAKWGGGHGLFTYYFIKGLCGYADEEAEDMKDGKVTLSEIKAYVEKHVKNDSRNLVTNQVQQMPYININNADNQEEVVAYIKPGKPINQQLKEDNLIAVVNRGLDRDTSALYRNFTAALEKKIFFQDEPGNAYSLLQQIKISQTKGKYEEAAEEYIIHLLNDAQVRINKYFEGVDTNYTTKYFEIGADELNIALTFMPKEHPLFKSYNINRLFMEARSMRANYSKYNLAIAKIDSALALDTSIAYLYFIKGVFKMDRLKWDEALPYLEKAHNLKPSWSFPLEQTAVCYTKLNKLTKAKNTYYEHIKSDSLNKAIWNSLGYFYFNITKQYDSAIICFKRALSIDSNYLYSLRNLGNVYAALRQNKKAKEMYLYAINSDSLNTFNWNSIALFYDAQKQRDSAIICFKKALTIDPDNLYVLRNLADIYAALRQRENAKEMYWKAIMVDSLDVDNWAYLGNFYDLQKQYDSAVIFYLKATAIDSNDLYSLRNLGIDYAALHENEKAKEMLWKAIKADSLNADNWTYLGNFYDRQKQYDSAVIFYLKATAIDSNNLYSLRNLGIDYAALFQNERAKKMLWRAIRADSLDTNNWLILGNFYAYQKQYDSAIIFYGKAIAIDSNYVSGLRNLGDIYVDLHQNEKAKKLYLRALSADPYDTDNWFALGKFFYEQKQYDSAVLHFRNAIRFDSLNLNAYNYLIGCFGLKDKDDSSSYYLRQTLVHKIADIITYELGTAISNSYQNSKLFYKEIQIALMLYEYDSANNILKLDDIHRINLLNRLAYAYLYTGQLALSKYYYVKGGSLDVYYYNVACRASVDKKTKESLENLELSFQNGYKDYDHLLKDTHFNNVRDTEEFKRLVKKYFP